MTSIRTSGRCERRKQLAAALASSRVGECHIQRAVRQLSSHGQMGGGHPLDANPDVDLRELEKLHAEAYSWALTCTRGRAIEAEDVLQMTYVAIMEGRARFGGDSTLRTWLFAVIRNTARSRWRLLRTQLRHLANLAHLGTPDDDIAFEPAPDERHAQDQNAARLINAWRLLPSRQREVLDLVFYRDLTIAEAATVLGIAVGTARLHYERAKASLRERLGSEGTS